MGPAEHVEAWRPAVVGVAEVLVAHFTEHAYPAHTHDQWTILLVDTGGVDYALGRDDHHAGPRSLTVLPPHVPHDGRAARAEGFDKRVVYVDDRWLADDLVPHAVRDPLVVDEAVRGDVGRLHAALGRGGDELEAESRTALVTESIAAALRRAEPVQERHAPRVARVARERLDADLLEPPSLVTLADDLGVHPTHVVRAFTREHGLPPHRYVIGRRVDRARRLLLEGMPLADVAAATGFYDQAHLTRHFRRVLGVTPGVFARHVA